jgi:hypothetical protein
MTGTSAWSKEGRQPDVGHFTEGFAAPPLPPRSSLRQPPRQGSNLGGRPAAYLRSDKVDGRLVQARPGPVFPRVDYTASPVCRFGRGRRADYFPVCNGSVDNYLPGHALARNWRQAAFACLSPSTRESTRPREAARRAACIPRHEDSGISAGCRVSRGRGLRQAAPRGQVRLRIPCWERSCVAHGRAYPGGPKRRHSPARTGSSQGW